MGIIGREACLRGAVTVIGALTVFAMTAGRAPAAECAGDCNGDSVVLVNELVVMVDVSLGTEDVSACPAGDTNHDNLIMIDEIVAAVGAALNGCAAATPMPTATPTLAFCTSQQSGCSLCAGLRGCCPAPNPDTPSCFDPSVQCTFPCPTPIPANWIGSTECGPGGMAVACLVPATPTLVNTATATPTGTGTATPVSTFTGTATATGSTTPTSTATPDPTATPTLGLCTSEQSACSLCAGLGGCCPAPNPDTPSCFDPSVQCSFPCPTPIPANWIGSTECGPGGMAVACVINSTPSGVPTDTPTALPTGTASAVATSSRTAAPTDTRTAAPTNVPAASPTGTPSGVPMNTATITPTSNGMTPTASGTVTPSLPPQTPGAPSRVITLNDGCGTELWIGAAGNNFSPSCTDDTDCGGGACVQKACTSVRCGSNGGCSSPNTFCGGLKANLPSSQVTCKVGEHDCPVNTLCNPDARVYSHDSTMCTQDSDCGTGACDLGTDTCYVQCSAGSCSAKETCDTMKTGGACYTNLCAYETCYYVPVPVPPPAAGNAPCGVNSDCTGGEFCFVANGAASDSGMTGTCTAVPTQGNYWDLTAGSPSIEVNIPTPWQGRFWARTGCQTQTDGTFTCATGQCTDANNQPTKYCLGTPTGSPTLAEFSFPPYMKNIQSGKEADDFYDVSMVDGANVQLQIAPVASTYDLTTQNGTKASLPNGAGDCPTEDTLQTLCADPWNNQASAPDCEQTFGWGWVCNGTACVNKFQCGSPGCLAGACGNYGYGAYVCPSTWDQTTSFALSESACPTDLHFIVNSTYVGCLAPGQACLQPSPPAGLNCGANQNLYLCTGTNSTSCYTSQTPSQSNQQTTCCGCPAWTPTSLCESGQDSSWTDNVQTPYLQAFHNTAPQAYSFPFDDEVSTFTCVGQSAAQNVSYGLNFCPRN